MITVHTTFRQFLSRPVLTMAAILTLTLGIGANTTIFSVVYSVLLKPLPYPDAHRLVRLREQSPQFSAMAISYPNFLDWQNQQTVFSQMGVYNYGAFNLTDNGNPAKLQGIRLSPGVFQALEIKPELGRLFLESDNVPGQQVMLISHALWVSRFGSTPAIINRVVQLDGEPFTIVGVMPAHFAFPREVDCWLPIGLFTDESGYQNRRNHPGLAGVARLKPGADLEQARLELSAISTRLETAHPDENKGIRARVDRLRDEVIGEERAAFWILFGAATLLLAIASVNVTNLLLARAYDRQREFSIRTALGASRAQILRQLVSEGAILTLIGCATGIGVALFATEALAQLGEPLIPRAREVEVDQTVLIFTALVGAFITFVFGLVPARHLAQLELEPTLRSTARSMTPKTIGLRRCLVSGQIALTLSLIVGTGLLLRSFYQLTRVNPGFSDTGVLSFETNLPTKIYPTEDQQVAFLRQLEDQIRSIPGVVNVGIASQIPLQGKGWQSPFIVPTADGPQPEQPPIAEITLASPDYFSTMDISLRRGRTFDTHDNRDHVKDNAVPEDRRWSAGLRVAIIDQSFAARHWPNRNPIGQQFQLDWNDPKPNLTVVGVVERVHYDHLSETESIPQCYLPLLAVPQPSTTTVVRSQLPPETLIPHIRSKVASINPDLPIFAVRTLTDLKNASTANERLTLYLMIAFGAIAVTLAATGLYGLLSHEINQRQRELGIRLTLGASRPGILKHVFHSGLQPVLIGGLVGTGLTIVVANALRSVLFRVQPLDGLTYLAAGIGILFITIPAILIPAINAASTNPMTTLRSE